MMNELETMKGVIFDMDGTMVDSMPIWNDVAASYLRKKGYEPEAGLWERLKFLSLAQGISYIKEAYGMSEGPEQISKEMNQTIEENYFYEISLKSGVASYLKKLWDQKIPMYVATATDHYLAEACLKRLDILKYFQGIITCEEVMCGKDDPAIFESARKLLKTEKAETYVIEDSLHAIMTAKNAGFPVIAIYDESAKEDWEEIKKIANVSVSSMEELV